MVEAALLVDAISKQSCFLHFISSIIMLAGHGNCDSLYSVGKADVLSSIVQHWEYSTDGG